MNPTAVSPISNITIKWTPNFTGLNDIELATLYSIYPNPAISNIYINGPGIKAVNIYNLEGKKILTDNQVKLNISALKKGEYIVNIETDKATISKKLIKR